MLVLSRYADEAIDIGENIRIMVVGFGWRNGRKLVNLGIIAPDDMLILRSEVETDTRERRNRKRGNA